MELPFDSKPRRADKKPKKGKQAIYKLTWIELYRRAQMAARMKLKFSKQYDQCRSPLVLEQVEHWESECNRFSAELLKRNK